MGLSVLDVAWSAPRRDHYHADVIYLLLKLEIKKAAWASWHPKLNGIDFFLKNHLSIFSQVEVAKEGALSSRIFSIR